MSFGVCPHGVAFDEGHFQCEECFITKITGNFPRNLQEASRDACQELLREQDFKQKSLNKHDESLKCQQMIKEFNDNQIKGKKFDNGKPQLDFIPYEAMEEMGKVFSFGAKKYNESDQANWSNGIKYSRLIAATLRHVGKFMMGQDTDDESGLSHLGHAMVNLAMLIWFTKHRPDLDNRWVKLVPKVEAKDGNV